MTLGALAICAHPLAASAPPPDRLLKYALGQDVAILRGDLERIEALRAAQLEADRVGESPGDDCATSLGAARFAELRASLSAAHEAVGNHRAAVTAARMAVSSELGSARAAGTSASNWPVSVAHRRAR